MLQNIICHNGEPKNDKENFKTRVENIVNGQGPASSHIVVVFLYAFRQLSTTKFQGLTMKCAFYCQILFFEEKTEREKANFAELQKLQATTELSCHINQSTVNRPYSFPSYIFYPSTGLISCLSTQKTIFMNHESKSNAIKSIFFLFCVFCVFVFFVFLFLFCLICELSALTPDKTCEPTVDWLIEGIYFSSPLYLHICCGVKWCCCAWIHAKMGLFERGNCRKLRTVWMQAKRGKNLKWTGY